MTDEEEMKRIRAIVEDEIRNSDGVADAYYLSFSDNGFLGACWVIACGPIHAVKRTHDLDINPGGQVLICKVPKNGPLPSGDYFNRLLNLEDLKKAMPGEAFRHLTDADIQNINIKGEPN